MAEIKNKKVIVAMSPHKSLRDSAGQATAKVGQAGGDKRRRVIVAMSGGVDSSVAAKLLKDQGHDLLGIFLHFWKDETPLTPLSKGGKTPRLPFTKGGGAENKCCSLEALSDARRVCQKVGLPFYTLNFSDIFKKEVVDYFLDEYKKGNTPNPCVRCNKLVKLGWLIEQAKKLGFDYVASGHYARLRREIPNSKFQIPNKIPRPRQAKRGGQNPKSKISKNNDGMVYRLFRAEDKNKDQSYFLYTLTQEQLKHLLFPLGDYKKEEVRQIAKKFNLPVASKKESQEICFIPGKSHNDFLKRYLKLKPGPIKLLPHPDPLPACADRLIRRGEKSGQSGEVIGEHQGLPLYTIGQRKGVEIGGLGPFYVARCDYKTNTLYVVKDGEDPALYGDKLIADKVNWIAGEEPKLPLVCEAVIRYRHKPVECKIEKHKNTKTRKHENTKTPACYSLAPVCNASLRAGRLAGRQKYEKQKRYLVKFAKPQRAITPGQSVVFYRKNEVLGGGIIGR